VFADSSPDVNSVARAEVPFPGTGDPLRRSCDCRGLDSAAAEPWGAAFGVVERDAKEAREREREAPRKASGEEQQDTLV
jgi:hypothetical protein